MSTKTVKQCLPSKGVNVLFRYINRFVKDNPRCRLPTTRERSGPLTQHNVRNI